MPPRRFNELKTPTPASQEVLVRMEVYLYIFMVRVQTPFMPVSTNPFFNSRYCRPASIRPKGNNDIMFIESEVTLLSVNNVNTTDPHFNMLGRCQSEAP